MSRVHNKHADALADLASKTDVPNKLDDVRIIKKTLQAADLIPSDPFDEPDWWNSIIQTLDQASSTVAAKDLKSSIVINGELYF